VTFITDDGTWVPVESGVGPKLCSLNVPEYCGQKAGEVLLYRLYPWEDWQEAYRCADHPAADSVRVLLRPFPMAEYEIRPL
jgi:hypothetical protein